MKAFVICPNENIGDMMALISEKRGTGGSYGNAGFAPRDVDQPASAERNFD